MNIIKLFLYTITALLFTAWYSTRIYIQGPDPGIDFLIDDASLSLIDPDLNWEKEANQRIEQIRKNNFTVR